MKKIELIAAFSRHGRRCKYALGGVFASQKLRLTILAGTLILSSCFSPYTGDESAITINFGSNALAVYPGDASEFLRYLDHQITLTGPTGTLNRTVKGGGSVKLYVAPGSWEVQVTDTCGGIPFAYSVPETFDVKRGENNAVSIRMYDEGNYFFTVNNFSDWGLITSATGDKCIILTGSFSATSPLNFGPATNVAILGNGKTITYTVVGAGSCFSLASGLSVTINDVNIEGKGGPDPLVNIAGGSFTMDGGEISGNGGFGVHVSGSGSFTMNGGTISRNYNYGVNVNGGFFTMKSGTISGNDLSGVQINDPGDVFDMNGGTISGNSGGVVIFDGSFTMNGGKISGNTNDNGGGVNILGGTFTMNGGTISGNTASLTGGGGIYIFSGTFIMSGGTISGNNTNGLGKSLFVQSGNIADFGNGDTISRESTPPAFTPPGGYTDADLVGKK